MEGDSNQLPVNSNDQLYHILQTDTFMYCLICLEDIGSTSNDAGKHLNSINHRESIKRLFKACNPSLVEDNINNDDRFVDILSKSVFDISVLLGKETCYICKRDNNWFCLMCEQNVTATSLGDVVVKDDIIDHVLSIPHVQKVKGVCFLYRLNTNQDFLLLNKSVVYCSVCKRVMQCTEVDLLNTAVAHLDMKHPNPDCAIPDGLECQTSSYVTNEEPMLTGDDFIDGENSDNYFNVEHIPNTELAGEVKGASLDELGMNAGSLVETVNDISMDNNIPSNNKGNKRSFSMSEVLKGNIICICLLCKSRIKPGSHKSFLVSINCHFKITHKKYYVETFLDELINMVTFHSEPDIVKFLSSKKRIERNLNKLIKSNHEIKNHVNYILKTETGYLCIICMVSMSPCLKNGTLLLENLHSHFKSLSHQQCEKEKMEISNAFKYNMNNKTLNKLRLQKREHLQRLEAQEEEREAKIKLRKEEKELIGLTKLEEVPNLTAMNKETVVGNLQMAHPDYEIIDGLEYQTSSYVTNEEPMWTGDDFVDGGNSGNYFNTEHIPNTELAGEVNDDSFNELGMNAGGFAETVNDISMHNNVPNNSKNVNKSLIKRQVLNGTIVCICLFCKERVKPVPRQSLLLSLNSHFKQSHRNVYIKTSLEDLMNRVTFHNDPDVIKLISKKKKINKELTKLFKRNREIKTHLNYVLKTETDYFCIICMFRISNCLDDNMVLLQNFHDHFNSLSHLLCEKHKMGVKQVFNVDKNNKTLAKLILSKENFKIKVQKKKAQNKKKKALKELRQLEKNSNKLLAN